MQRMVGHCWTTLVVLIASSLVGGCATWTDRSSTSTADKLPLLRLGEDRRVAAIEFDFFPIVLSETVRGAEPVNDLASDETVAETWASSPQTVGSVSDRSTQELVQSLWQWVDETGIEPGLRRRLSENGMRIGRVMEQERFMNRVQSMTPNKDRVDAFLQQAEVASESNQGRQRIQMRIGRRYELPVRQPISGTQVSLLRVDGQTIGQTVQDPQYLFAVTVSDGSTEGQLLAKLRPEIQHGSMKQTYVSSDSALRIENRRSTWSLEQLEIDLAGREGDLFVISGMDSGVGLGSKMFGGEMSDGTPQQTILLLKFAHVPTSIDRL